MASLTELPTELLAQVLSCISAKSGLANLRLVNRRINEVTTTILFSHITLYAMYNAEDRPLPPSWRLGYDAQVFKNIIEHSALKTLVKYVTVYACETHCVNENRVKTV
jgi:hypothetical protein